MATFKNILDELKSSIEYEEKLFDDRNEPRPKYLPSLKRLLTASKQPTKKLLEYNKKLIKEKKMTNYIDTKKFYNTETKRYVNKNVRGKPKKEFEGKNFGSLVNVPSFDKTDNNYKKDLLKKLINFRNSNLPDLNYGKTIEINLLKIKYVDVLTVINNSKINNKYLVVGRPKGGQNWITFSPTNLTKLTNFQKLLSSDFTNRFGSDNEFTIQSLENKGFIIQLRKKMKQAKIDGAFFKYYHNLEINFERYGIHKIAPKDYKKNCLFIALQNGGLSENDLNKYLMYVKSGYVPICNLNKIANHLKICIKLSRIRSYNHNGDTHTDVSYFGKKDDTLYSIGLYDQHYFINDKKTNITSYALKNYNDIKHINQWNKIYKKDSQGRYKKSNDRDINSFQLVQLLIENKDNLLTEIPIDDLMKTQYYTQTINDECLEYNDKECCDVNEVRQSEYNDVRHLYNIYFDFETDTSGIKHIPCLMCGITEEDEEVDFVGKECGKDFLNWIKNKFKNNQEIQGLPKYDKGCIQDICLIAHNCRYDFTFIMDYLYSLSPILKGNRLMGGTARIYTSKDKFIKIIFRDSSNFLAMKLGKFHEVFEIEENKEILPYSLYTTENIDKVLVDKDECLEHLDENDKEEFLDNCNKWNCDYGDCIDIIEYSKKYCYMDCVVLKKGWETFTNWMLDITGLNINHYCSIASIALDYIVKEGCFNGCYKLSGIPRDFIQKCVVGGRVMCRDNKKWKVEGKINDFDAVSLYPSAMSRMKGFLKGIPKVIKNKSFDWLKNNSDGFFIKVLCENNPTKNRHFSLLSSKDDKDIRDFTNNTKGKIYYLDKTSYEDCVKFQGLKFKILAGYYYNEGHNNRINTVIKYLFNERLKAKTNKNPIQAVYKLLMNSCYGKALLKPIDSDTSIISKKQFDNYLSRHYNYISNFVELEKNVIVKEIKTIEKHFNNVYAGVEILTMSKRIMNEVICLAEDNNLKIYYQDTDSIHINDSDIKILEEKYNKLYNRELIGKDMGQFHSDFEMEGCKDIYCKKAIFLGKKCYLDCLVGRDIETGEIKEGYHIRMKGVNREGIEYFSETNNISIEDIYDRLYDGDKLEFDLLAGGKCCKFKYNSDMSVSSVNDFCRSVSFKYEEGIMV